MSPDPASGLVVRQWYLDTFYDDLEKLPYPSDDGGGAFDAAVEKIERQTQNLVDHNLAVLKAGLAEIGVRLEVQPR